MDQWTNERTDEWTNGPKCTRPWAEVTLAHLFKELPVVGGVQVTLTEDPYVAYGVNITGDDVPCRGIDTLKLMDVAFGAELGYDIKLVAAAERWPAPAV